MYVFITRIHNRQGESQTGSIADYGMRNGMHKGLPRFFLDFKLRAGLCKKAYPEITPSLPSPSMGRIRVGGKPLRLL